MANPNMEPYEPDIESLREKGRSSVKREEADLAALLASKMIYFEKQDSKALGKAIKDTDVIAWDIYDLQQIDVTVVHSFEQTEETPLHSMSHRMAPRKNAVVKKQFDELFQAEFTTPESSAWSFPVVIATKKDGKLARFCVDYRQLNRGMNPY